jgi:hypothetical protein
VANVIQYIQNMLEKMNFNSIITEIEPGIEDCFMQLSQQ